MRPSADPVRRMHFPHRLEKLASPDYLGIADRIYTQEGMVDAASKERMIGDLRTIVEKVQEKVHLSPNNPDIIALRRIVQTKITELEMEEISNPLLSTPPSVP